MTARYPDWVPNSAAGVRAQVLAALAEHGLEATPADLVDALVGGALRARRSRPRRLRAKEVGSAASNAERLRRYRAVHLPPVSTLTRLREGLNATTRRRVRGATPEPGPVTRARSRLIERLDNLNAVIRIAAGTGENIAPILARLESGTETAADLAALIAALERLPTMRGGRPPDVVTGYLVSRGVMAWEACGRPERYTYNEDQDPVLRGPRVDFLRALVSLAGLPQPSDDALHQQLQELRRRS